jgi:hypothetical protein
MHGGAAAPGDARDRIAPDIRAPAQDGDVIAVFRKAQRGGETDAGRAARDDRDRPFRRYFAGSRSIVSKSAGIMISRPS